MAKPSPAYPFNTASGLSLANGMNGCYSCWEGIGSYAYSYVGTSRIAAMQLQANASWSTDADGPVVRTTDAADGWAFALGTGSGYEWDDGPASLVRLVAFTVAVWVTVRAVTHDDSGIIVRGESNRRKGMYISSAASRTVSFRIDDGSAACFGTTTSAAFTVGEKVWLVGVWDGSQTGNANRMKFYVAGVAVSLSFTGTIPAVGSSPPVSPLHYLGSIDGTAGTAADLDVSMVLTWFRALSAGEVAALINDPVQFLATGYAQVVTGTGYYMSVGQDPGTVDGSNNSGNTRATPYTQSDAAKATFLGYVASPITETFDTFPDNVLANNNSNVNVGTIVLSAVSGATVTMTSTSASDISSPTLYAGSVIREVSGTGVATVVSVDGAMTSTIKTLATFSGLSFAAGLMGVYRLGGYDSVANSLIYITGSSVATNEVVSPTGTNSAGRYPYSNSIYVEYRGNGPAFHFYPPATAVGCYYIDLADQIDAASTTEGPFVQAVLRLTYADTSTLDIDVPHYLGKGSSIPANGSMGYVGVIATDGKTITTMSLLNLLGDGTGSLANQDVIGVDNVTWALSPDVTIPPDGGGMAVCPADVQNLIFSIRDQIPDPPLTANDPTSDGAAFTYATLLRWVDDAGRIMCGKARVIVDWHAITSRIGMDTYELPPQILDVMECWYDLQQLGEQPQNFDYDRNKITAPSYTFGHHASHAIPRFHVWPTCDRSGAMTTLAASIGSMDSSIILTDASQFKPYGFMLIDSEIIMYRTITTNTLTGILRGQSLTLPASHTIGGSVTELNIMFKVHRLPMPCNCATRLEIPMEFWPLIELYVISKVREAEQDHQTSRVMRDEFNKYVDTMAEKNRRSWPRQGTQVGPSWSGPLLYNRGRVIVS